MDELAKKFPSASEDDVRKVISESDFGVFTEAPKRPFFRHVNYPLIRGHLAIDIAFFDGFFGGSRILLAHCLYSKQIFLEVLRRISGMNTANALRKILDRCGFPVFTVLSDRGTDMLSQPVQKLLRSRDIKHVVAGSSFQNHAWSAERSVRTIRGIITRLKYISKNNNLYQLSKKAEKIYNTTKHSTTKLKPVEVGRKEGPKILLRILAKRKGKQHPSKIEVGSIVRLKRSRNPQFVKGSAQSLSTVKYRVVDHKPTSPYNSFKLQNKDTGELLEGYYPEPLLRRVAEPTSK